MTQRQATIVLALSIVMIGAASVFAAPLWRSIDPATASAWAWMRLAVAGAFVVPPALLALWAALGRQRAALRWALTTWLLAVFYLLLSYGEIRNSGGANSKALVWYGIDSFVAYVTLQIPLLLPRICGGWRLQRTGRTSNGDVLAGERRQFTLRDLLVWVLAVSSILAGLRWLLPRGGIDVVQLLPRKAELNHCLLPAVLIALAGLPVLPTAWVVLASGRRPLLRSVLAILTLVGIVVASGVISWTDEGFDALLALVIEVAALAAAMTILCVMRSCGFRLARFVCGISPAGDVVPAEAPMHPRRRFVFTLLPLLIAAGLLVWYAPRRVEMWQQVDEAIWFDQRDWHVGFDGRRIVTLIPRQSGEIPDDVVLRMSKLTGVERLHFLMTRLDDRQLEWLSPLNQLEMLDLGGTAVTDSGARRLRHFFKLKELSLSGTAITDIGLRSLSMLKELQMLDLSETAITDAGLMSLSTLANLKHLDLRDTNATQRGCQQLARFLPQCAIQR